MPLLLSLGTLACKPSQSIVPVIAISKLECHPQESRVKIVEDCCLLTVRAMPIWEWEKKGPNYVKTD